MANLPIFGNEYHCAEIEKPAHTQRFWFRLAQMARKTGRSYIILLIEIIALKVGRGKLSFSEYAGLALYDNAQYGATDKKAFVGFNVLQKIWITANYRYDFYGLVNNKITTDILLGSYGLPIMPTIALFREQVGISSPFMVSTEEGLRTFLQKKDHYPLFGKPVSGHQSLGSASISHYDAEHQVLIATSGHRIPLDTFITYVKAHAASGYLLQFRMSPHAMVRELCGNRLATVRILTILTNGKPKVLRACWKIPAGNNIADNFWRPGNLLAQLDENGCVLRVVRENAAGIEEVTHHPDTGKNLIGAVVPHWQPMITLVSEGAKVIPEIALIGWDIAPLDSGPVVVEVNETPDFRLHQLADSRGMLDDTLQAFLHERKAHAKQWLNNARHKRTLITELVPAPTRQTKET